MSSPAQSIAVVLLVSVGACDPQASEDAAPLPCIEPNAAELDESLSPVNPTPPLETTRECVAVKTGHECADVLRWTSTVCRGDLDCALELNVYVGRGTHDSVERNAKLLLRECHYGGDEKSCSSAAALCFDLRPTDRYECVMFEVSDGYDTWLEPAA